MTRNKCIFVHIPKAAGTSVLQALTKSSKHVRRDHCTIQEFIASSRALYNSYFSFAFVREPTDRVLSIHRYLMKGGNHTTDFELSSLIREKYFTSEKFVFDFLSKESIHLHKLTTPQHRFICDENGKSLVNYVGKFESIDYDFAKIANRLKIGGSLPKSNQSSSIRNQEVQKAIRERVKELYSRDFELFYPERLTD
jgi:hypothetical protein